MTKIAIIAAVVALNLHASVAAAPFQRYPGSHLDEHTTELANRRSVAKAGEASARTEIYVTTDPYEKVLAFYRRYGREFVMPGGLARPTTLPEGKSLRQTYIILDKSAGLRGSKSWVKIQNPYAGPPWKGKLKEEDQPLKELTAIMHVRSK